MLEADEGYSDVIEAELIAKIKGEFCWTPAMVVGTAYHSVLEHPQKLLTGRYESNGVMFEAAAVDPMLDRIDRRGVFEVKTTKSIGVTRIAGAGLDHIVLVTKADHLAGAHLSEFKTTLSSFDPEKYLASYQWRVMSLLFEPQWITYHVACLKEEDPLDDGAQVFGLRSLESMNVFPYPHLESDVRHMAGELVQYVKAKGLESYLTPSWMKAGVMA